MANGDAVTDSSPVFSPLYQQIKALLLQSLEQGEWNAGEMIPSEVDLALRYKVSQGTVRKAIDELTAENLLVRRQGRGTFVATHQEPVNRFRFLRMQKKDDAEFKTYSSVLAVEAAVPPVEVRERLQMKPNQQATVISRLLSFGDEPAVFEHLVAEGNFSGCYDGQAGELQRWFIRLVRGGIQCAHDSCRGAFVRTFGLSRCGATFGCGAEFCAVVYRACVVYLCRAAGRGAFGLVQYAALSLSQ